MVTRVAQFFLVGTFLIDAVLLSVVAPSSSSANTPCHAQNHRRRGTETGMGIDLVEIRIETATGIDAITMKVASAAAVVADIATNVIEIEIVNAIATATATEMATDPVANVAVMRLMMIASQAGESLDAPQRRLLYCH